MLNLTLLYNKYVYSEAMEKKPATCVGLTIDDDMIDKVLGSAQAVVPYDLFFGQSKAQLGLI
jgi:hypothetical protein